MAERVDCNPCFRSRTKPSVDNRQAPTAPSLDHVLQRRKYPDIRESYFIKVSIIIIPLPQCKSLIAVCYTEPFARPTETHHFRFWMRYRWGHAMGTLNSSSVGSLPLSCRVSSSSWFRTVLIVASRTVCEASWHN